MSLSTCPNGHFYDSDRFQTCPHCGGTNDVMNNTIAASSAQIGGSLMPDDATVGANDSVNSLLNSIKNVSLDDEATVGAFKGFSKGEVSSPTVGWLICLNGKNKGKDFKLKSGRNFIGRNDNMDIALRGENSVSRDKHAIVVYEPKKNAFLAQAGESKELFYLNGELVVSANQLKRNDKLQLGDVELMFIPCCDEKFKWDTVEETEK